MRKAAARSHEDAEHDPDPRAALHTTTLEHPDHGVETERDEQRQHDVDQDRGDRRDRGSEDDAAEHAQRRDEADDERTLDGGQDAAPSFAGHRRSGLHLAHEHLGRTAAAVR